MSKGIFISRGEDEKKCWRGFHGEGAAFGSNSKFIPCFFSSESWFEYYRYFAWLPLLHYIDMMREFMSLGWQKDAVC